METLFCKCGRVAIARRPPGAVDPAALAQLARELEDLAVRLLRVPA